MAGPLITKIEDSLIVRYISKYSIFAFSCQPVSFIPTPLNDKKARDVTQIQDIAMDRPRQSPESSDSGNRTWQPIS